MKKLLSFVLLGAACLFGQTSETAVFVAAMSPANEVPPITDYDASGTAVLYAHVMRNAAGQIVSGSVDFLVLANFPAAATGTGLHIHAGPAGANAGVTVNTGLNATNTLALTAGRNVIQRQAQVLGTDMNGVATLRGLWENPQNYYVNLHTTQFGGGIIRGQLYRGERKVLLGRMDARNEVPAITAVTATGTGTIEAIRAYDARQRYIAGIAIFDIDYNLGGAATVTGLHIHNGPAGANAGVVLNTGIGAGANSVETPANGIGNITRYVEVPANPQTAVGHLEGVFDTPELYYVNLHTTTYGGGLIRSQLARTETITMPVLMSPANEVPPIAGLEASGVAAVHINAIRNTAGAITAARFTFDVNYRFPGETTFTGLHIHDGRAGVNAGVSINSGLSGAAPVMTATGFGNIWRSIPIVGGNALTSLNSLVTNPENHYLNLHTTVNAGGAVRGQMGPENARMPRVVEVISAVSDLNSRTLAHGGQFTIFGEDLIKVASNLGGLEGMKLPTAVNGTSVTIGGVAAPIIAAGIEPRNNPSGYIVAQVPFEVQAGSREVVVRSANGTSNGRAVTVAAVAPALFFDGGGAIAFNAANVTQIRPDAPARAGDQLVIVSTGLGQVAPPLATGDIPSSTNAVPGTASVTIGGVNAPVLGSAVIPGLPGIYGTLVGVPPGVGAGMQPVILRVGTGAAAVTSNTVMLPVR
jgi:uncharacterized protein (TIGR03437 family)